MLELREELLKLIFLHVQPRHLYKVLQTCKTLYNVVYWHSEYWDRVAAQIAFEDVLADKYYSVPNYHNGMEMMMAASKRFVHQHFGDIKVGKAVCLYMTGCFVGKPWRRGKFAQFQDADDLFVRRFLKQYLTCVRGVDTVLRDFARFLEDDDTAFAVKREFISRFCLIFIIQWDEVKHMDVGYFNICFFKRLHELPKYLGGFLGQTVDRQTMATFSDWFDVSALKNKRVLAQHMQKILRVYWCMLEHAELCAESRYAALQAHMFEPFFRHYLY